MKKQLFAFALLVFALLPILASAKYIGPDPPKGCTTCGCSTCGCSTCGGAPSRSVASNTSSAISATEGNMTERVPISTVGATLGLAFVYNTYNADSSRATVDTVMGYGWTHSYNVFLFSQAGVMFRWDGEGRVTRYGLGPGGTFTAAPGYFETLTQSGGVFTITQKDQTKYTFMQIAGTPFLVSGPVYRLTKIVDRNGNTTTLTYSGGNLTRVTDTYGRSLSFTYNAQGKMASVKDPLGRTTAVTYDSTGHKLTQIADPNGKTIQYSYNTFYQLTNKTDKAGRTFSYVYSSGAPGLPISVKDSSGTSRATLSNPGNWATDPTALAVYLQRSFIPATTTNTDGRGNQWKYSYDSNGYLTQTVAPDGATMQYSYDPGTLQVSQSSDANGNVSKYTYDSSGNLLSMKDPPGNTTTFTYDPVFNMLKSITDPLGRTTTYTIDPGNGNRLKETDPLGQMRSWTYDSNGNVLTDTDKDGNTTKYQYDTFGDPVKITDPLNNVTTMTYDASGNVVTRTDADNHTTSYQYDGLNRLTQTTDAVLNTDQTQYDGEGNVVQAKDRLGHMTQFQYDSRQRLIKTMDALNQSETYTYDGNDNRVSMTDRNVHITTYAYDVQNRLISVTDALGNVAKTTYDPVGNVTSQTDANGHTTTYTYDTDNRRITMRDALLQMTSYQYDTGAFAGCGPGTCGATPGSSLVTGQTDANGKVVYFKYDALNRQIRMVRKVGSTADIITSSDAVTIYAYDAFGNRTSVAEPNGNTMLFQYDADNRKVRETNGAGDVTQWGYDGVGNITALTAPNLNVTTSTYDALNRVIQVTDSVGLVSSYTYDAIGNRLSTTDGNGNTTTYAYDALNRLSTATDPLLKSQTSVYDPVGNLTRTIDRNGFVATHTYDNINRRISTMDAVGNIAQSQYDGVGNLTRRTDGNGHATQYAYDAVNRLARQTYANATFRTFTYDGIGNLTSRTDQMARTTNYAYSDLYFLLNRFYPSGINDGFTYDLSGRLLSGQHGTWLVTWNYDGADRVTQTVQNGQTISYSYNIPGRTRSLTYPGGRNVTERTDPRTRLTQIDDTSTLAQYTYDNGNRVTNRVFRNGTSAAYSYNANDWATAVQHSRGITPIAGFTYTYDGEGNKQCEGKTHDPTHSEAYQYDHIYRVTNYKTGTLDPSCGVPVPVTQITYSLDAVGNLCKATDTCQFDNVNQEIRFNGCTIPYDPTGNPLNDCKYSYTYDEENRLLTATRLADSTLVGHYQYDALGRRVQKIANTSGSPATTRFFYDSPRVIEEQTPSGTTLATYVYGNTFDEVLNMVRGAQSYYYHQNALGTVEAVTDGAGAVAERYSYDPYGAPAITDGAGVPVTLNSPGSTPHSAIGNPWMFQGRGLDEETGLYDFRARVHDTARGRFMQRDVLEPEDNLYEFAKDNPINVTDPTGMFPVVVSQGFAGGNYFWRNNFDMYDVVLTIGPIPPVRPAPPAPAPIGFGLNLLRDVWLQVLTISNACVDCWPPLRSRAQLYSFWEYWQRGAVAGPGGLTRIVPIAFGGLGVTLDIYGYGTDFHAANYRTNPPPAPPAVPCTCGEIRSIFSWANSAVLTFGAPPLLGMFPYGIPLLPGPPGPARLNPGLPRVLGLPLPSGGVLPWGFTVSCGPGCGTLAIPCARLTRWGFIGA